MVAGLAVARLLSGVARIVQHPHRKTVDAVHLLWVLSVFLSVIHFWWWEFRLAQQTWTFVVYLFVVFYASLLYSLCALLLPEDMSDYADYRDYFLATRKWFFGLLAVVYLVDVIDTALKGRDYFLSLGPEYPARTLAYVALSLVAMFVAGRRFHIAFVVANLVYQVSFILRYYQTIG
jgi:hypothetical protein